MLFVAKSSVDSTTTIYSHPDVGHIANVVLHKFASQCKYKLDYSFFFISICFNHLVRIQHWTGLPEILPRDICCRRWSLQRQHGRFGSSPATGQTSSIATSVHQMWSMQQHCQLGENGSNASLGAALVKRMSLRWFLATSDHGLDAE